MLLGKGSAAAGHTWDPYVLRCSQMSGGVVKGVIECLTLVMNKLSISDEQQQRSQR